MDDLESLAVDDSLIETDDVSKSVPVATLKDATTLAVSLENKLKELRDVVAGIRKRRGLDKVTALAIESIAPDTLSFPVQGCTEDASLTNFATALEDLTTAARTTMAELYAQADITESVNAILAQTTRTDSVITQLRYVNNLYERSPIIDALTTADAIAPDTLITVNTLFTKYLSVSVTPMFNEFMCGLVNDSDLPRRQLNCLSTDINYLYTALTGKLILAEAILLGAYGGKYRKANINHLARPIARLTVSAAVDSVVDCDRAAMLTLLNDHVEADAVEALKDITQYLPTSISTEPSWVSNHAASTKIRLALLNVTDLLTRMDTMPVDIQDRLAADTDLAIAVKEILRITDLLYVAVTTRARAMGRIHYIKASISLAMVNVFRDPQVMAMVERDNPDLHARFTKFFN